MACGGVNWKVPLDELGEISARLEQLTLETVVPPVRFVKSIGDAVMLVSPDAPSLLDAALTLVDAAGAQHSGLPELRAGVATGPALSRAGDWFGRPVNLASRITTIARPGSVLAAEGVQEMFGNAKGADCFVCARHVAAVSLPKDQQTARGCRHWVVEVASI